jgi:iron(III) transport system substrate-binding protein
MVTTAIVSFAGLTAAQEVSKEIVDAAKKEGKLTVYGSPETEIMKEIQDAFERKYGVKVEYWRASSTKVLDRALTETRVGKPLFDVVLTNKTPMRLLKKEGAFGKFTAPASASYPQNVKDPDGVLQPPYRMAVVGLLYNPRMVKPAEAPKSWKDLLDPKWKGKIVMPDPTRHSTTTTWLANLEKLLGKDARSFREGLAAQKPLMVESFIPSAQKVIAGEAPLGISYIKFVQIFGKKEGAPLDWVRLKQSLAEPHFLALGAKPTNTNAGKLFINFLLTPEALKILAAEGEFVLLRGVHPPIPEVEKLEIVQMDDLSEEELKKARGEYKKLFF